MSLRNIPTRSEPFSVAARLLTNTEVKLCATVVENEARVFFDSSENSGGPRKWPSYYAFLGFQIAKVAIQYQLTPAQLQDLVSIVYERNNDSIPRKTGQEYIVIERDPAFDAVKVGDILTLTDLNWKGYGMMMLECSTYRVTVEEREMKRFALLNK